MPNDNSLKDLDKLYTQARTAKGKLLGTWFLNLSYYRGGAGQWVGWNGTNLFRPTLRSNRITITDNRIQPAVRTEVARMLKNRPVFMVSPTTNDEEDQNASELGEQLMRYLWPHLNMPELASKALHWSRICSAGFFKTFWDPSIGESTDVVVGPGNQVLTGADGKALRPDQLDPAGLAQSLGLPPDSVRAKTVNQGDIRVEVRSPFQMFPDPLADTFEEAEWLIEESVKSPGYVLQRYGKTVQPDTAANPGLIESRLGGGQQQGSGGYKGVKVREYWCRPNGQHPDGRRVVWTKDQTLFEDNSPFDPWPYVMLSGIPVPGQLWPTSIVEQLRGPQDELNKVKSQIAENRNRVGNPTAIVSSQQVRDADTLAERLTMPGGIVIRDEAFQSPAVEYLAAPALPQYVIDEIQRIEESIQEISGQHDVSAANVPPGVTAASAINLLLEADATRIGPAIADYERQLGKLGQKVLKLAAHYYTDTRTIRIGGDNGVWQIFDFRGSMLRDNTHVEVQAGSAFPESRAAKQAAMQDLLNYMVQSGNPIHGKQLAEFLRDWEVGGANRLISDYTLDQTQIERENIRLFQGVPLPVNDYDNDEAHIDGHQDEQKSQRYDQGSPQAKQAFEMHVQAHKQRLAAQQQAQMQLQQQQENPQAPQQAAQGQLDLAGAVQQQGAQQAQAAQQQDVAAAQAQHQIVSKGAQQGHQMQVAQAQAQQSQSHAQQLHEQRMRHADEAHRARLAQQAKQGGPNGRQ